MAENLYPVFSIPSIQAVDTDAEHVMRPGPLFDFDLGDFVRDGSNRVVMVDGRDSYILWVLKALKTQYGAFLSYLGFGIDYEGALSEPGREAIQAAFERAITEAMMVNPCTDKVLDFFFEWDSDNLYTTFTVKPKAWPAINIAMTVV